MQYTVHYPSGHTFVLEGRLGVVVSEDENIGHVPAIEFPDRQVLVLDPRALVTAADTGAVLYDPRANQRAARWVRVWLAEHRLWPPARAGRAFGNGSSSKPNS